MITEATLRLFKGLYVEGNINFSNPYNYMDQIKNGFYVDERINYNDKVKAAILKVVMTPEVNATFFESWEFVKNTPNEHLFLHQAIHYITTYGLGMDGYIPNPYFKGVRVEKRVPVVYIKGLTKKHIYEGIVSLASGVALSDQTLQDIFEVMVEMNFDSEIISKIKNRELITKLNDLYDIVPTAPTEFLRHWIHKLTNQTILIKNRGMYEAINTCKSKDVDALIPFAPKDLASIFYRFKPIFLALKKVSNNKRYFNQLRRKAVNQHKPMPEDFMGTVINKCLNGEQWHTEDFINQLHNSTIYRKIRLLNEVNMRLNSATNAKVYKIRNGKTWTTERKVQFNRSLHDLKFTLVININMSLNVKDKVFYIPSYIDYTCPTSEKDFMGNIPCGSSISLDDDMIVGMYWENVGGRQTDLDLSSVSLDGKVGWDAGFKSNGMTFSGDITNAPNGANENFLISKERDTSDLFMINYFNHSPEHPVPAKIFVARADVDQKMVDINKVLMSAPIEISANYNLIGLHTKTATNNFFFQTGNFGNIASSRESEQTKLAREYFTESTRLKLTLKDLLQTAGAKVVNYMQHDSIDLSPNALSKETFIELLNPKETI